MPGFKLPNSIFNKIAALPEFNAIAPKQNDQRRTYLNTILSLAWTEEPWSNCCNYGMTPQDLFTYFDEWERSGLFAVIPMALRPIRNDLYKWLNQLPRFTTPLRGRYKRQVLGPNKPREMTIDLVLNETYRYVTETPFLPSK